MYLTDNSKEKSELNNPKGYFRTMCDNLNITMIPANSPQAKGRRVERGNKTHQGRLIKLMRLKNITNIEEANKYLEEEYVKEHNEKFASKVTNNEIINNNNNIVDIHRKLSNNITLNDICYVEEVRKLRNEKNLSIIPPTKSIVYVRMYIDKIVRYNERRQNIAKQSKN
jgi:hypothetical protein